MIRTVHNLAAGFRLGFWPRRPQVTFRPGIRETVSGLLIVLLLVGLFDYARQDGEIAFYPWGLVQLACLYFLGLFTLVLICRLQSDFQRLPWLMSPTVHTLAWFLLVVLAFRLWGGGVAAASWPWWLILAWGLVLLMRVIRQAFAKPRVGTRLLAALAAVLVVYGLRVDYLAPQLFYSYTPEEYATYEAADVEATYYRQPGLLQAKLDGLLQHQPGEVDVYFLGFAGNGTETVFDSEVRFAQKVVEHRYRARGRSLVLSSSVDQLEEEPLANTYNLATALGAIGERMDVEEDILFLFLTSHGSRDAALQVALYPFEQRDLRAEELRRALDAARIRWRVIVISACYAGSFIDALADEHSLVITAAAEDRTSFGCSSERDLTYFGEALFQDALPASDDLLEAFNMAAARVSAKERDEGLENSNPQLYLGERIVERPLMLGYPRQERVDENPGMAADGAE